ncbi:hypothetical protein ACOME3_000689 [Neoechinorhynchus agilis]
MNTMSLLSLYDEHRLTDESFCDLFCTDFEKGLSDKFARRILSIVGLNVPQSHAPVRFRISKQKIFIILSSFVFLTALAFYVLQFKAQYEVYHEYLRTSLSALLLTIAYLSTNYYCNNEMDKSTKRASTVLSPIVHVVRNEQVLKIPSFAIVPGDILILEKGDEVPADVRIIQSKDLIIRTTIPSTVSRFHSNRYTNRDPTRSENFIFASSRILQGNCWCAAAKVGSYTFVSKTLDRRCFRIEHLKQFISYMNISDYVSTVSAALSIIGMSIYLIDQFDWTFCALLALLYFAISSPLELECCLKHFTSQHIEQLNANGVNLLDLNSLYRLANANVICFNGLESLSTLLNPRSLWIPSMREMEAQDVGQPIDSATFFRCAALCCNQYVQHSENDLNSEFKWLPGHRVNEAIQKILSDEDVLAIRKRYKFVSSRSFNAENKMEMAIYRCGEKGQTCISFIKGALEPILEKCSSILLDDDNQIQFNTEPHWRDVILEQASKLSMNANIVIGFADLENCRLDGTDMFNNFAYKFLGLMSFSQANFNLDLLIGCAKLVPVKTLIFLGEGETFPENVSAESLDCRSNEIDAIVRYINNSPQDANYVVKGVDIFTKAEILRGLNESVLVSSQSSLFANETLMNFQGGLS